MIRKITIAIMMLFGLLVLSNSKAQTVFYSQKLQNIYNLLSDSCRDNIDASARVDTIILYPDILKNDTIPLIFAFDENKVVEHIGYRFLSGIDTVYDKNIVRFIEREILNLLINNDIDDILKRNYEDKFYILYNGNSIEKKLFGNTHKVLNLLKNVSGFMMERSENSYRVDISDVKQSTLSFLFPADYELIYGMDKKESDDFVSFKLQNHIRKHNVNEIDNCIELQHFCDSIFVCKGSQFMISQINNDLYYSVENQKNNLVFDTTMLSESFSNAMLLLGNKDYTIEVKQRKYGSKIDNYIICSQDFFDFFTNYDKYFGIEPAEKDLLKGSLIMKDRSTNTIFIAFIEITEKNLMAEGIMKMTLTANIPQHNLSNLFGKH